MKKTYLKQIKIILLVAIGLLSSALSAEGLVYNNYYQMIDVSGLANPPFPAASLYGVPNGIPPDGIFGTHGMGIPRGDATPFYWDPVNTNYKTSDAWNIVVPWFVIWPGNTYNSNSNARVKISKIIMYALNRTTNKWSKITPTNNGNPTWAMNFGFNHEEYTTAVDLNASGYKFDSSNHPIHGGLGYFTFSGSVIDPSTGLPYPSFNPQIPATDVAAVYGQLTAKLVPSSGTSIPPGADVYIRAAADYYKDIQTNGAPKTWCLGVSGCPQWAPRASGNSYIKVDSTTEKTYSFATISDPRIYLPQTSGDYYGHTPYNGPSRTISLKDFNDNPPPVANFLLNPGFESTATGVANWYCYGTDCTLLKVTSPKNTGTYALKVSDRSNTFAGPHQDIKSALLSNGPGRYYVNAYVRSATGTTSNATITVHFKDAAGDHWPQIWPSISFDGAAFKKISGVYDINWMGALQAADIYIETPNSGNALFYVDDVWIHKKMACTAPLTC